MQGLFWVVPDFLVCMEEKQTDKANDMNRSNAIVRRLVQEGVFFIHATFYLEHI